MKSIKNFIKTGLFLFVLFGPANLNAACADPVYGEATVHALAFSPNEKDLAFAHDENALLWKFLSDGRFCDFGYVGSARALAFSPGGGGLAVGSNGKVDLVDLNEKKNIFTFPCKNYVFSVAFSPDGKTLAIGEGGNVEVWNLNTDTLIHKFECKDWVCALAFNPDGNILAFCVSARAVKLLDLKANTCNSVLEVSQTVYPSDQAAAFTSDGNFLAFVDQLGKVELWDLKARACINVFKCGSRWVTAVALNQDGMQVAAGCSDGNITIWKKGQGSGEYQKLH